MNDYFLKLLILVVLISGCNANVAPEKQSEKSLNEAMSEVASIMTDIYPQILAESPLDDKQNQSILNSVNQLQALFQQVGPFISKKSTTYQLSYELIQDYLAAISDINNPVDLRFVKERLKTLGDFCVSCHTQDNAFRTLFTNIKTPDFKSLLAKAEYNYTTRNYLEAANLYEKHLLLTANLKEGEILQAVHRILVIYIQVLNNSPQAHVVLERLRQTGDFPELAAQHIGDAIDSIKQLPDAKSSSAIKFSALQDYVVKYLGGSTAREAFTGTSASQEVESLWLRGVLFRYMNSNPDAKEIPYLLYWLALCYRSIGYGYDYTLADFYLKQCVKRYASHPMARQCFNEYKEYVKFYFTTPVEPVLPMEVDKELDELEDYLYKGH